MCGEDVHKRYVCTVSWMDQYDISGSGFLKKHGSESGSWKKYGSGSGFLKEHRSESGFLKEHGSESGFSKKRTWIRIRILEN